MTSMSVRSPVCMRRVAPRIGLIAFSMACLVAGNLIAQDEANFTAVQLATGEEGRRILLSGTGPGQLRWTRNAEEAGSAWYVIPVGTDLFRLQQLHENRWFALGVDSIGRRNPGPMGPRVGFAPLTQSANQLWRIQQFQGGGYLFENASAPGLWLTCIPQSGLWLQAFGSSPWQVWWPQQPVFAVPPPMFRTMSEQIVASLPLAPATLRVNNTHSETILIVLADRRNPTQTTLLRIPAGGSESITLDRDSGGTIVQTIEVMDPFGNWDRQEYQIPIPPSILYDMSVYEEFLQSIAIDRTGKSPNVIEDINYQPRSVGFFMLPAGNGLPDSGALDAYNAAVDANNPGAVRRLSQKDASASSSQPSPQDPLRELLDQIQGKRGKF